MIKNFILLFLVNKKDYFIQIKENTYNLIIINANLLSTENRKINIKTEI